MIFFDWRIAGWLILALLTVVGGVFGMKLARKVPGLLLRVAVRIAASVTACLGLLVALLLWASSALSSHSAPIYSPSGKMAVRIEEISGGATDGSSWVELYWACGLKKKMIFSASGAWVEPADIHWESDSKFTIHYQGSLEGDGFSSTSAGGVKVECSPRPIR